MHDFLKEQSTPMLLQGLATCSVGVVTVSPQSVCSIAAKRGIEAQKTARLIARHFKRLGVRYVLDSSFGRYLTLALSYDEFVERRHEAPILTSACPGFGTWLFRFSILFVIKAMQRVSKA